MPLCRYLTRFPLYNAVRLRSPLPPTRWLPAQRKYSTALDGRQKDERPPPAELDLNKVSVDSAFLDFILGSPKSSNDEEWEKVPAVERRRESGQQQPRTRRERMRTSVQTRGDAKTSPRPARRDVKPEAKIDIQQHTNKPKFKLSPAALKSRRIELKRSAALSRQGIHVRSKWIRMRFAGSHATFFSSFWNMEIAKLQRRYNKKFKTHYLAERKAPSTLPEASTWAQTAIEHICEDKIAVLAGLTDETMPRMTSLRHWQHAVLWLLHHEPERVADILRISHASPYPPAQCVADILDYLAAYFVHLQDTSAADRLQALADVFPLLADRQDASRLSMDSSFFAHILPHCTDFQVNQLYQAIKRHHVFVLAHTYLHFATYFSRNERFDQALDAILSAKNAKVDLNSFEFRSNCSTLLRNAIRHPDGLRMCLRIVDNLVKMGLTLNNQIANVIMLNAVEAGDLNTAFSIYQSLTQHGLEPDLYTFAILLKACKTNIDDTEGLNTTIRSAIENVDVLHHPIIATEILHCLALHHSKHHPERAFNTVADAYAQLFDVEPMHKLGLSLPTLSKPGEPSSQKMQPTQQALHIMISTYLEQSFKASDSTLPAWVLYQRYRLLADSNIEPFATSLQNDYIANSFLQTFIKTTKGLFYATQVIKSMQNIDSPVERCKPTVQSWSIFLHGFTRHRQFAMAEQILTYMRSKGVEPNEVTWNTLSMGYAGAQNVEGTLDALRRMEVDGFTWDRWTVGGLRRLKDQARLVSERNKRDYFAASMDFTDDLKEDLASKIAVFGEKSVQVGERKKEEVETDGVADSPADLAAADVNTYRPM